MKTPLLPLLAVCLAATTARADFSDIVDYFQTLNDSSTVFPVSGMGYDDIESSFGPRNQVSVGGVYDWHRGIDIDGGSIGDPVGVYSVVAAVNGTFYDYRQTTSGGHIVILRHDFDTPQSYQGKTLNYYYTWYLHLYDDGGAGSAGTDDIVSGWTSIVSGNGTPTQITAGTQIGWMGDSGSPGGGASYAPHLHFELRIGSNASLEYQLDNPGSTQWGFDPHVNPMLLFNPYTYGSTGVGQYDQLLALEAPVAPGEDIVMGYTLTNDDMPVFNRVEVVIRDKATQTTQASHTLDLNEREGYDASTTEALDTQDTSVPYLDPAGITDTEWVSTIVVPAEWAAGYDEDYEVVFTVSDIWGNTESEVVSLVPEPATWAAAAGLLALGVLLPRRARRSLPR
jgi:hypothetical protein